jgi:hypothetical protein
MMNEVLCKLLAHDVGYVIAAWYELGIEPVFGSGRDDSGRTAARLAR